ncbi:MAG: BatD family protein [Gammaproteobacteria bacterium]
MRWLVLLIFLAPAAVFAAVTATVDRNRIEINESLTLLIEVDGETAGEPDLAVLEEDFEVLGRNQTSSTTIVNGRVSRSRTWAVSLMAKRTGELVVPAVPVGNESSAPLTIDVDPISKSPPGEADIFLLAEVDSPETWVQAQVIYTVKIFIGVSPLQPRLDQPDFGGVEVLVQPLGDDRRYESVIGGRTYAVVERRYALFPQASGTLSIGASRFQARVREPGRASGRKVFLSESIDVEVRPVPPPPAAHPDAAWLPALDVTLEQEWDPDGGPVTAGEPVTRTVRLAAAGLLANQIPPPDLPVPDGVRSYPDQPELETVGIEQGVQGIRTDRYALVAARDGELRFETVEIPWWDIRAGEWRVATLEPTRLEVLPGAVPPAPEPAAGGPPASEALPPAPVPTDDFWYRISLLLAGGWALTLIAWWYSRRRTPRVVSEPREAPRFRLEARRLKAVREACRGTDTAACTEALLAWGSVRWPDSPPRSLGELAARVPAGLAGQLEALNRSRYGTGEGAWDGRALVRELDAFVRGGRGGQAEETDGVLARLA